MTSITYRNDNADSIYPVVDTSIEFALNLIRCISICTTNTSVYITSISCTDNNLTIGTTLGSFSFLNGALYASTDFGFCALNSFPTKSFLLTCEYKLDNSAVVRNHPSGLPYSYVRVGDLVHSIDGTLNIVVQGDITYKDGLITKNDPSIIYQLKDISTTTTQTGVTSINGAAVDTLEFKSIDNFIKYEMETHDKVAIITIKPDPYDGLYSICQS